MKVDYEKIIKDWQIVYNKIDDDLNNAYAKRTLARTYIDIKNANEEIYSLWNIQEAHCNNHPSLWVFYINGDVEN